VRLVQHHHRVLAQLGVVQQLAHQRAVCARAGASVEAGLEQRAVRLALAHRRAVCVRVRASMETGFRQQAVRLAQRIGIAAVPLSLQNSVPKAGCQPPPVTRGLTAPLPACRVAVRGAPPRARACEVGYARAARRALLEAHRVADLLAHLAPHLLRHAPPHRHNGLPLAGSCQEVKVLGAAVPGCGDTAGRAHHAPGLRHGYAAAVGISSFVQELRGGRGRHQGVCVSEL
jgi:hypothetical protein